MLGALLELVFEPGGWFFVGSSGRRRGWSHTPVRPRNMAQLQALRRRPFFVPRIPWSPSVIDRALDRGTAGMFNSSRSFRPFLGFFGFASSMVAGGLVGDPTSVRFARCRLPDGAGRPASLFVFAPHHDAWVRDEPEVVARIPSPEMRMLRGRRRAPGDRPRWGSGHSSGAGRGPDGVPMRGWGRRHGAHSVCQATPGGGRRGPPRDPCSR